MHRNKNDYKKMMNEVVVDRLKVQSFDLDKTITHVLYRVYASRRLTGYYYISEALKMIVKDPQLKNVITKYVYSKLADIDIPNSYRLFTVQTPSTVERNIRYSIENMWFYKQDGDLLDLLFIGRKLRPSNGVFLCTLADYIKLIYNR